MDIDVRIKIMFVSLCIVALFVIGLLNPVYGATSFDDEDSFDIDPEELTAGVKYDSLVISEIDSDISGDLNVVISYGDREFYDIDIDDFDSEESDELDLSDDDFVFNESGVFNVTITDENNTVVKGEITVYPPDIEYTIDGFDMEFIATSGLDREYEVNITALDFEGNPIENGTLWMNCSDDVLNASFFNGLNCSDEKYLELDSDGNATFGFTPNKPVEVYWKVGCESVDSELKAGVVDTPLLIAESPHMEVYSPTLNQTLTTGDDNISMGLPFGETHELMVTLKTANLSDAPLEDGIEISADGSITEYRVYSTTEYNEGYSGQFGWISITPTATGSEAIELLVDGEPTAYIDVYKGEYKELEIDGSEEVVVGEEIVYTVSSSGTAVEDAEVIAGDRTGVTNEDGEVVFTFNSTETVDVFAEKEGDEVSYYNAWMETEVKYDLVEKDLNVEIKTDKGHIVVDRAVEIEVTSDGEPIENATISTNYQSENTDSDGLAVIYFTQAGEHELLVEADGYQTGDEVVSYNTETLTVNVGETPGQNIISTFIIVVLTTLVISIGREIGFKRK
ncbi:Cell surface protein [Methanonatronarchaeum thermophilum]|uniref:Cell surface protein n=1 Tax=Methanonatronarchaeum thermophilum TaxID=1927129 RepID=A0A1Y3GC08_9EURY|nr:carboxypeptidase-like regulatory domain-containing protein [Methanonatronarchaeum thermophilum]OUJ19002.1 Cell surface protein [Methanonatronarchaeum thermophilum]